MACKGCAGVAMRPRAIHLLLPRQRASYVTSKPSAPPQPRPWKPTAPSARVSRQPDPVPSPPKPSKKQSVAHRLFSLRASDPPLALHANEPRDIARGIAATRKVLEGGGLDERYKPAARRVTAIIVALPIAIYLSWELFQRRFMGKEVKIAKGTWKDGHGEGVEATKGGT